MTGWMFYSVFISFAAPILLGFWLGNRAALNFSGIIKGALLGLIFMLAISFTTELQGDLFMWKSRMAEISAAKALGADWIMQALGRALRTLTITYVFYLMVYGIRVFLRGRDAHQGKSTVGGG